MDLFGNIRRMYNRFTGGRVVAYLSRVVNSGYARSKANDPWLDSYSQMPWARAVVGAIAGGVASLEWGITRTMETQQVVQRGIIDVRKRTSWRKDIQKAGYAARKKALATLEEEGQSEPIFEHPFLEFWKSPCPMLPGNMFHYLCQIYWEIAGEVFILVDRGPRDEIFKTVSEGFGAMHRRSAPMEIEVHTSLPTSAYPIPPNWVKRLPTPDRPSFEIQGPAGVLFDNVPMSAVWWLKNPDPVNPYMRGSGMMMSLGDELNADENASRMMNHRFYNRGTPEALVTLEGATKDELGAFSNDWISKNQGATNAFRVHFANFKAQVEKMGDDFRELQLLELRKYMRDMIRQVPGIPPEIMGILDQSNRATIDASEYLFNKRVVIPRGEIWRTFLQERVIPLYDPRAVIDYVSPLTEDKEYTLKVASAKPMVVRVKEWRRMADLPPLPPDQGELFLKDDGTAVRSLSELLAPVAPIPGMAPPGAGGMINVPGATAIPIEVPMAAPKQLPPAGGTSGPPALPAGAAPASDPYKLAIDVKGAGVPKRKGLAHARTKSQDEALLVARWKAASGASYVDMLAVFDESPRPISANPYLERARRGLTVLRSVRTDDPKEIAKATAAWEPMLGAWNDRDEEWLGEMLEARA